MTRQLRYQQVALLEGEDCVRVSGRCSVTQRSFSMTYDRHEFLAYLEGDLCIQDAMPTTSVEGREWLQSSTSPAGWAQMVSQWHHMDEMYDAREQDD